MSMSSAYGSLGDPLAQRASVDCEKLGEQAALLCAGKLGPAEMAELPWGDARFGKWVQKIMAERTARLEQHEVRFRALREVFGPER